MARSPSSLRIHALEAVASALIAIARLASALNDELARCPGLVPFEQSHRALGDGVFHDLHVRLGKSIAPARFLLFGTVFLFTAAITRVLLPDLQTALLFGFDVSALVFLVSVLPLLDHDISKMRHTSQINDANRPALLALTVLISLVILFSIGTLIAGKETLRWQELTLIVVTLVLTWFFANTVYALHYAHLYYLPGADGDRKGLEFPGTTEPCYWDFLYFSFTLGMTFQTSDVVIRGAHIRRVALGHSMAAFLFNMGILAFTINALGGL